jgi:ankyrin repeat protein
MMSNRNLISLCREDNVAEVRQMIAEKCDVNVEVDGVNPLSVAIEKDNRLLASILLDAGATLQQLSPTLLQLAVSSGSADVAELFISRGMDVTAQDIIDAACSGHCSLVVLLLNNFKPQGGATILHLLPSMTQPDENPLHKAAVDFIVEKSGALIDALNSGNWTPLQRAADTGNAYVASALIKAGADMNAAGGEGGFTALTIASKKGDVAIVKALLDAGRSLQVNAKDARGNTALHLSAMASSLPVVEALLEARADPNAANKEKMTPLFYASSAAIASALLEAGADADHRGKLGFVPVLATSSSRGMATLVDKKDDFIVKMKTGETASVRAVEARSADLPRLLEAIPAAASLLPVRLISLTFATSVNDRSFVQSILNSGGNPNIAVEGCPTPLMVARSVDVAECLLDAGAHVNARFQDGTTALMFAVSDDKKDATLVTLLLERGADAAASRKDGGNSIMLAASKDRVDVLKLLLRAPNVLTACINEQAQNGATALIVASAHGATAAVEALIAAGADVHLATNTGHTALHFASNADIARLLWNAGARDALSNENMTALSSACIKNKPDVVEFLLQRGLDVNALHGGRTALMHAAHDGHLDVLRVLLAADPPVLVNLQDGRGSTALSIAAANNQTSVVELLLAHGANDNASFYGATCLMQAAHHDHLAVVELLLARFPTLLNARAQDGATALHIAVLKNALRVVDALLAAGADTNIARNDGLTPLMMAVNMEMAQRLIDGGADANVQLPTGDTALMLAAADENPDLSLIALLLERGADVAASRKDGGNALLMATCNGRVDVLKLLLQAPAAWINAQTQNGKTALIVASMNGTTAAVEALIGAGADINMATHTGHTALHFASNADIARLLWNAGARDAQTHDGTTPLMSACIANKPDIVVYLLQRGLDVNALHGRWTALMHAAHDGHLDVLRVLLAADPPVVLDQQDSLGRTALYYAVESNHPLAVRMLLAHGANINITTNYGTTPLLLGVQKGLLAVVDELLLTQSPTLSDTCEQDEVAALSIAVRKNFPHGADPNIADINGYTPLMVAPDAEMARRLLDGGADVSARSQDGTTALMFAVSNDTKDTALVTLLLERGADVAASRINGWNSLLLAAKHNRTDALRLFLSAQNESVQWVNTIFQGYWALRVASEHGATAIVEALIAAGADVHLADNAGCTALHMASNPDIARLLWNAGANDNTADILRSACINNKPDVVEFLLQRGVDVNALHGGLTPLMRVAREGRVDILRVLLAADPPVEVDQQTNIGCSALYFAVKNNHPMAVKLLLAHGANSDFTMLSQTPLMYAINNGYFEVVEEFVLAGYPKLINARDLDGETLLLMVASYCHTRLADALLAAGADPNIADNSGCTPLMVACGAFMNGDRMYQDADVNARLPGGDLARRSQTSDDHGLAMVMLLLERGADMTAVSNDGSNLLMVATSNGEVDVLQYLLASDTPLDVNKQNDEGHTALFMAVAKNNLTAVKLLLAAGADPRTANGNGIIPLMRCTSQESVKMLVDAAPDLVNHTCNKGRRALAYLASRATLEELFASSARHNIHIDVNHADVNGDTALHMAMLRRTGCSVVQLLLEKGADTLGVGYGGTTVLTKQFAAVDRDIILREYGIRVPAEELADSTITENLKVILDHVLSRDVADAVKATSDCVVDKEDGSVGEKSAAKRQRR